MNVTNCEINLLKKLKATVVDIFIELSDLLELFQVLEQAVQKSLQSSDEFSIKKFNVLKS